MGVSWIIEVSLEVREKSVPCICGFICVYWGTHTGWTFPYKAWKLEVGGHGWMHGACFSSSFSFAGLAFSSCSQPTRVFVFVSFFC